VKPRIRREVVEHDSKPAVRTSSTAAKVEGVGSAFEQMTKMVPSGMSSGGSPASIADGNTVRCTGLASLNAATSASSTELTNSSDPPPASDDAMLLIGPAPRTIS
jgi:hypothetical protein